jgi:hypothetical protein
MITIATTRFNKDTWIQNKRWRENNNFKGCIYGTPLMIRDNIPPDRNIFILEMHNDKNEIKAIGFIKNRIVFDKKYKIYDWGNYNRYIYKGKYRIKKNKLNNEELFTLKILEKLVFKGSRHLKRGQGITQLPEWILKNKIINFTNKLKNMFIDRNYIIQ